MKTEDHKLPRLACASSEAEIAAAKARVDALQAKAGAAAEALADSPLLVGLTPAGKALLAEMESQQRDAMARAEEVLADANRRFEDSLRNQARSS